MAKFYLINTITVGTQKFLAGQLIDDTSISTSPITAAGGILVADDSAGLNIVAAAAAKAQQAHARGASEHDLDMLMQSAMQSLQVTEDAFIMQHVLVDVPLATIQAQTSGVAFNVGAALPANARLLGSALEVVTPITGGTISAMKGFLQNTSETAGAIEGGAGGVDCFTAAGHFHGAGSNPHPNRGGQQLQLKLTATGDTLAHATAGEVKVHLMYFVAA